MAKHRTAEYPPNHNKSRFVPVYFLPERQQTEHPKPMHLNLLKIPLKCEDFSNDNVHSGYHRNPNN